MEPGNEVPRFASFRPKLQPTVDRIEHQNESPGLACTGEIDEHERSLQHEGSRHRSEHQDRYRHRRRRSKDHHAHHHDDRIKRKEYRDLGISQHPLSGSPQIIPWEEQPDISFIDRKGDPNNLVYGTIHRYNVPHYHRFGAGCIIGIPTQIKIDQAPSNDQRLMTSARESYRVGHREKYVFAKNEQKLVKKLRLRHVDLQGLAFGATEDYIPLCSSRRPKRRRSDDSDHSSSSLSNNDRQNYRSIKGKAKHTAEPKDPDLQHDSLSSASEFEERRSLALSESMKQQNIALSRRVADEPANLQVWLEFIRHQGTLLGLVNGPETRNISRAEQRSTADIKLSLYEKAVKHFTQDTEARERLLVGMMEEGAKVWETKKQASKWNSILRDNPDLIGLWEKYLNFEQTNLATFSHDGCSTIYRKCIQLLKSAITDSNAQSDRDRQENILIYVMLRMTLFLRESGFSELSIAIWQALLETNFFMPKTLQSMLNEALHGVPDTQYLLLFEQFWESEVARIGEIGAKGWDHYFRSGGTAPDPKTQPASLPLEKDKLFETWLNAERSRGWISRDPLRTADEAEEDDPYSVILFSDVKDFITYFTSSISRRTLLDAFLLFCTLPPLPNSTLYRPSRSFLTDPFLRSKLLEQYGIASWHWNSTIYPNRSKIGFPPQVYPKDEEQSLGAAHGETLDFMLHEFPTSTETLFAESEQWISAFDRWEQMYPDDTGPIKLDFVRQSMKSLVAADAGGSSLVEYYLAFEWNNWPESVKKVAKSLLKKRSSSLRLYNAYALIEYRSGNIIAASHVLTTALNMSQTFNERDQLDAILLWRTWAWELIYSKDHATAVRLFLTFAEMKFHEDFLTHGAEDGSESFQPSAAALLKAQRALDQHLRLLSQGHTYHAVLYVECQALLTYLSQSHSLTVALPILESLLKTLNTGRYSSSTPAIEQTHLARAKLLLYHAKHVGNYRPALLREKLSESISLFPNNTIFLSLFAWNESRSRLDDRVRGIVRDVVLKREEESSIIGWFFAIQTELRRGVRMGSTKESVRAVFERALATETGRCSASLWKLYVLFSLNQQEDSGKRAKDVFYRGMRNCPWAKNYIMLAFSTRLRDLMSFEELRGVYNVLGEKELRVFVGLEHFLERLDENKTGLIAQVGEMSEDSSH